jgi:hypothetical protein
VSQCERQLVEVLVERVIEPIDCPCDAVISPTVQETRVVEQLIPGPPGPAGPPGPPGGTGYTHTQAVAAAIWTINHNLARYPSVTVVDSAGTTVWGRVDYLSANALTVTFSASFTGKAHLN